MIETIIIKSISIIDKKADGSAFLDKNGNPFKMANLVDDRGRKSSCFLGKFQAKDEAIISTWKEGDQITVLLEESGNFLNFKIPNKTDLLEARVTVLEERLDKAADIMADMKSKLDRL